MTLIGTDTARSTTGSSRPAAGSPATRRAPTAPGALPLLGHWPRFGRRPYRFLSTLPAVGPVVRVRIPGYDTYVVTDPELVRESFVALSDQGMMIERAEALLGEGVTVLQGQRHRRERRMIAPAFAKARIARYAEVMTRHGAARADSWRVGQVLAVNEQMHDLALRTVAGALFSGELGAETAEHIHRLLPPVMTLLSRRVTRPAWIDRLPLPGNRRFTALVAEMKTATGTIISAYRAELAADPELDHGDLLDTLLKARDESGAALTDSQVHDELINFLVGGTEAIGATLAWVFHELGANPAVEAALHAEVDAVLDGGRAAEFADLARLEVTKRIVLETLRKYSPWLTVRHVPEPYVLGGVEIPAGSMLFVCPVAVHRDPAVHADPLRFDPDRWLPERMADLSKGAHLPFGMGARQCPGNIFALTEIALQVATISARWRLRPIPGIPVRETVIGALVHPEQLPMQVEAR
ncbi:cytochrome P450 [Nocardia huaxiensis]|uniref:Cytochrome P450 n=1 Tax=Nocardia huaxiensis TaxID=2755382 RepID=A0A7D6Z1J6_9NOCA|nr:cytochrome P450 [Nocardia huaxiensis]QLY30326.1 cytochrome P450 [Nocardia huaxiensis]UFS96040.1 cytochrome P450 [Nocardia huaxiensis]